MNAGLSLLRKIYTPYNKFHLNTQNISFKTLSSTPQASENWIQIRVPLDSHKKTGQDTVNLISNSCVHVSSIQMSWKVGIYSMMERSWAVESDRFGTMFPVLSLIISETHTQNMLFFFF